MQSTGRPLSKTKPKLAPAGAVQRRQERALRHHRHARVLVVQPRHDADRPLRHRRQHLLAVQDLGDVLRHVQALEPRERQQGGGALPFLELAEARLHVAAEVHDLDFGLGWFVSCCIGSGCSFDWRITERKACSQPHSF